MRFETKNIFLEPFDTYFGSHIYRWFMDEKYRNFFRHHVAMTNSTDFEQYPRIINGTVFVVMSKVTLKIIGMAQMTSDWKTNKAFYAGILIDESYRNKRLATEIMYLLLNYGFNVANFRKAIIEVLENDSSLIKTLEATGFKKEGVLIDECYHNGKFLNEIRYYMLKDKFDEVGNKFLEEKYLWAEHSEQQGHSLEQPQAVQLVA